MSWGRRLVLAVRGPALIVTAIVLGLWFPQPERFAVLTTPLVALLIFGAVHGSDKAAFRPRDRPTFTVVAIAIVFLISVVFAPVPAIFLDGATLVGVLVATAAPPTAGSAIVWTRYGDGDAAATVLITLSSIGLAPLLTPAVLTVVVGRGVQLDAVPVVFELFLVVGGGIVLSWLTPDGAVSEPTVGRLSFLIVGALVYVGTATSAVDDIAVATVVTVGLLALAFLALAATVAFGSARFVGRSLAVSLFFSSGLRNLGIGVAVATALHVDGVVVAVVIFYVVQQLVATLAAEGVRERYRVQRG